MSSVNLKTCVSVFNGKSNEVSYEVTPYALKINFSSSFASFMFAKLTNNDPLFISSYGVAKIIPETFTYSSTKTIHFLRNDGEAIEVDIYTDDSTGVALTISNAVKCVLSALGNFMVAYSLNSNTIGFTDLNGDSYVGYILT